MKKTPTIYFDKGMGVVGNLLKNLNIYGETCTKILLFFHPLYDIYQYPCVQCCLELGMRGALNECPMNALEEL